MALTTVAAILMVLSQLPLTPARLEPTQAAVKCLPELFESSLAGPQWVAGHREGDDPELGELMARLTQGKNESEARKFARCRLFQRASALRLIACQSGDPQWPKTYLRLIDQRGETRAEHCVPGRAEPSALFGHPERDLEVESEGWHGNHVHKDAKVFVEMDGGLWPVLELERHFEESRELSTSPDGETTQYQWNENESRRIEGWAREKGVLLAPDGRVDRLRLATTEPLRPSHSRELANILVRRETSWTLCRQAPNGCNKTLLHREAPTTEQWRYDASTHRFVKPEE